MACFNECEKNVLTPLYKAALQMLAVLSIGGVGCDVQWFALGRLRDAFDEAGTNAPEFMRNDLDNMDSEKDLVDFCWKIKELYRDLCILTQQWEERKTRLWASFSFPIGRDIKPMPDCNPSVEPPSIPMFPREVFKPPLVTMRDVVRGLAT